MAAVSTWILPLRDGENEEARYAIRSWVANAGMAEGDRLVTIGGHPPWLRSDLHLPGNHHKSGPANVYANVRDACAAVADLDPDDFPALIVNDDFYAMAPVDPWEIAYRSTLREHIGRLPQRTSWWASSLRLTHNYLRGQGVETPLSYELHRPFPCDPRAMATELARAWNGHGFPVQWRTVYGNLRWQAYPDPVQAADGKIVSRANFPPAVDWWSTTDASWRWVGDTIRKKFPEPTRWEH